MIHVKHQLEMQLAAPRMVSRETLVAFWYGLGI